MQRRPLSFLVGIAGGTVGLRAQSDGRAERLQTAPFVLTNHGFNSDKVSVRKSRVRLIVLILVPVLLGAVLSSTPALAQRAEAPLIRAAAVPNPLRRAVEALGDRVSLPGRERVLLSGTITDSRGRKSSGQILFELPDKVRLEQTGGSGNRQIAFDGQTPSKASGSLSADDRRVLESLAEDTPEAFFNSLQHGAALRFLGGRFRTDDGTTPNYQGPWLSAYSHMAPVKTADQPVVKSKQFLFDALTGLLNRVQYVDQSVNVVTQFTWMDIDGQRVPKSITRTEGGIPVFAFEASGGIIGPRVEDGAFSASK